MRVGKSISDLIYNRVYVSTRNTSYNIIDSRMTGGIFNFTYGSILFSVRNSINSLNQKS